MLGVQRDVIQLEQEQHVAIVVEITDGCETYGR